jgi:hypothetical protein
MSLAKIGLVLCVEKGGQVGARCYNTSVQRQGYSSYVQQQQYNWAKQSVCQEFLWKRSNLLNFPCIKKYHKRGIHFFQLVLLSELNTFYMCPIQ